MIVKYIIGLQLVILGNLTKWVRRDFDIPNIDIRKVYQLLGYEFSAQDSGGNSDYGLDVEIIVLILLLEKIKEHGIMLIDLVII